MVAGLVDEEHDFRRLHDAPRRRGEQHLGHTLRQAVGVRLLAPELSYCALVVERLGPRLERHWLFDVAREVPDVAGRRLPDAGEIRRAVGQTWCRGREVRLAVRRARDLRRGDVGPLRRERNGEERDEPQRKESLHAAPG